MNTISLKQIAMIASVSKSILKDATMMRDCYDETDTVSILREKIGESVDKIIAIRGACTCSQEHTYHAKYGDTYPRVYSG